MGLDKKARAEAKAKKLREKREHRRVTKQWFLKQFDNGISNPEQWYDQNIPRESGSKK